MKNNYKKITIILFIATVVFGFIGFFVDGYEQNVPNSLSDWYTLISSSIFSIFGLFQAEFNGIQSNSIIAKIFISTAMVLAVLTLMSTILIFVARIVKEFWFFNVTKKPYILIFGAGETGKALAEDILTNKKEIKHLVVVEKDEKNPNIDKLRNKGAMVIVADGTNEHSLKMLNIKKAKEIIFLAGDDLINMQIYQKVKDDLINMQIYKKVKDILEQNSLSEKLILKLQECLMHNQKPNFYIHFQKHENHELINMKNEPNTKQFNIYDNIAQIFFSQNPLKDQDPLKAIDTQKRHLAIVGFEELGSAILHRALNLGHFYDENERLKVSIYDKKYKEKENEFKRSYPNVYDEKYKGYWDIEFKDENLLFGIGRVGVYQKIVFTKLHTSDSLADISNILKSQSDEVIKNSVKLFIYSDSYDNMEELIKKDKININDFGYLKDVCTYDIINNQILDNMAIMTNANYNALHEYDKDSNGNTIDKQTQWDNLTPFLKDSNRFQVEHLKLKVMCINELLKKQDKSYDDIKNEVKDKWFKYEKDEILWDEIEGAKYLAEHLSLEEMEKLAKMEKRRWNAFHILNGWRTLSVCDEKGEVKKEKIKKDTNTKLHPCLVEWDELKYVNKNHQHSYESDDLETVISAYALLKSITEHTATSNWIELEENKSYKKLLSKVKKYKGKI